MIVYAAPWHLASGVKRFRCQVKTERRPEKEYSPEGSTSFQHQYQLTHQLDHRRIAAVCTSRTGHCNWPHI
eukprot:5106220-Amphidinium_carterae.2